MPTVSLQLAPVRPSPQMVMGNRVVDAMTRNAVTLLRLAIGAVFVWFGALKIVGHSPAAALVMQTVRVFPIGRVPVVVMLGVTEAVIGFGLLFGLALRATLVLFIAQQAGTFLVLIICPDVAFQHHNVFLLTMTGEFVVKNLVFMAAGLAVGAASEETRRQRTAASTECPPAVRSDLERYRFGRRGRGVDVEQVHGDASQDVAWLGSAAGQYGARR